MERNFPLILFCLALIRECTPELDAWKKLNRGGSVSSIAVDNRALYVIDQAKTLMVIDSDGGIKTIESGIRQVDVDNENGLFIVKSTGAMSWRAGISSSDAVGTAWNTIPGLASGIATGRHGVLLHWNSGGSAFVGTGITSSNRGGSGWKSNADIIKKSRCNKNVCFSLSLSGELFSSGLIGSGYSPELASQQLIRYKIGIDISDISAFSDSELWEIDSNGIVWEAVKSAEIQTLNSERVRRGYQTYKFRKIAVSDKMQFAIADDNHVRVLAGCSIFDFEDGDLSQWKQTGTAFAKQPVVSQEKHYRLGASGKEGNRMIDTFSSRASNSVAEDAQRATQGNEPVGTLTSPSFQIRTQMLHFIIGGGSPPRNYVSLYVDGVERFQVSGTSRVKTGANGKAVRAGRYWWDVSSYINKCAYIKLVDEGTSTWGHTMFDDLSASPPCFKGMEAKLIKVGHDGNASIGQEIEYKLQLKGFYVSPSRILSVKVSFPTANGEPFIFIKNVKKKSQCTSKNQKKITREELPSAPKYYYSYQRRFVDYLLSDVSMGIVTRVYDHKTLQKGVVKSIIGEVMINFADEYLQTIKHELKILKHGNETTALHCQEDIIGSRQYEVGDNITYNVLLNHTGMAYSQRAFNVMLKIFLPPYLKLMEVEGMERSQGDNTASPSKSQIIVTIPEIRLEDDRNLTFILGIKGDYAWNRFHGREVEGVLLIDSISFCPRKSCKNAHSNDSEITSLIKTKEYTIKIRQKQGEGANIYTKIVVDNGTLVIICDKHQMQGGKENVRCYYGNSSERSWYSLSPILSDVTYYDITRKRILGFDHHQNKIGLYGEMFREQEIISSSDWEATVAKKETLVASFVDESPDNTVRKHASGKLPFQRRCCSNPTSFKN